jgi:flagellar basal-body rod protein FlgF
MDRGLYIAASGMLAELVRQDQLANDLANASTPGYKSDRAAESTFGQLLLQNRATGEPVGPLGLGAQIAEIRTDFGQGPVRETGEPLDVALLGDGFLAVRTPAGIRFTRDGQLSLEPSGRLVTAQGLPVLDDQGREIVVKGGDPEISQDGTLSVAGRQVAKLAMVLLTGATKEGGTLFGGTVGPRPAETIVRQRALEGADVNPARAMVDMIVSMRTFESVQRVIHAIDETLGKGINGAGA